MDRDTKTFIIAIAAITICILVIYGYITKWDAISYETDTSLIVDKTYFEGTWLNNYKYDNATVQLFFYNVFDEVIIYTRNIGDVEWSQPDVYKFTFHSIDEYNHHYVFSFNPPLELWNISHPLLKNGGPHGHYWGRIESNWFCLCIDDIDGHPSYCMSFYRVDEVQQF